MARMHSRKKGKARSTRPSKRSKPTWLRYKETEVEMLIVKLAKEGKSPSQIGLMLRDAYGVPDIKAVAGRSVTKILKERKLQQEIPEDLLALIRKSIAISKHMEENKQDTTALRGSQLAESKIKRLAKYYKKKEVLPLDWKFDKKSIKIYAE